MRESIDRFLINLEQGNEFSSNTVSAYRNDLGQFFDYVSGDLGLNQWSELEPTHLTTYVLRLREREYATSTVARKTAAVKSFFGYLHRNGDLRSDPAEELSSPRVKKYVPKAISEQQIQELLLQPTRSSTPDAIRDHAMLQTLYATGMRVTELVSLDIEDVDLDAGSVCCTGKQNRRRHVELCHEAIDALRQYLERGRPAIARSAEETALFLNHRGSRLTRQGFWLILKTYAEAAGIEDITPHTLRHSFAAHQVTRGRNLNDLQRILGHVSISTTQVYQRIATDLSDGHAMSNGHDAEPVSGTTRVLAGASVPR